VSVAEIPGIVVDGQWRPLSTVGRLDLEAEVVRLQNEVAEQKRVAEKCRVAAGLHAADCQTVDQELLDAAGEA
jgi:hypothetical protein